MVPCILDQIFARVRKQGAEIEEIKKKLDERNTDRSVLLAGIDGAESAPEDVKDESEEKEI